MLILKYFVTSLTLLSFYSFLTSHFYLFQDHGWRFESDGQEIPAGMWGENEPNMELDKLCAIYNATSGRLSSALCTEKQHYLCVYKPSECSCLLSEHFFATYI